VQINKLTKNTKGLFELKKPSKELKSAIASLSIEDLTPSDFAIELAEMQLRGEIRREEIVERILEYYGVKR
jgi:hypothetical protein